MWSELDHPIIRPQIPLTPLYEWGPTWSPHCGEFTVPGDTLTSIWDNLASSCSTLDLGCVFDSPTFGIYPFESCFGFHICIYTVYVYIYYSYAIYLYIIIIIIYIYILRTNTHRTSGPTLGMVSTVTLLQAAGGHRLPVEVQELMILGGHREPTRRWLLLVILMVSAIYLTGIIFI